MKLSDAINKVVKDSDNKNNNPAYYVLLTLDLHGAGDKKRKKFDDFLETYGLKKFENVTTTWHTQYEEKRKKSEIIETLKNAVSAAAKNAGITSYNAVIHIGDSKPTEFRKP